MLSDTEIGFLIGGIVVGGFLLLMMYAVPKLEELECEAENNVFSCERIYVPVTGDEDVPEIR